MSKHKRQGMKMTGWTFKPNANKMFVIDAQLDTFLTNQLFKLSDAYIAGVSIEIAVKTLFHTFTWFVSQPERAEVIANLHFNFLFLAEVVDYYIANDLLIDGATVHFDGDVTWQ